jgi:geranylgeranyl diphosphate synthase type II
MTAHSDLLQRRSGLQEAIERELREIFKARTNAAAAYGNSFVRLWTLAGESVHGGKLVRPFLLMETYEALHQIAPEASGPPAGAHTIGQHGEDRAGLAQETVISIASAIELLHYSFLLHDDVIDGDLTRRGGPNLIGALLAETVTSARNVNAIPHPGTEHDVGLHWARTGGILMGDLLLANTHQTFARARLPHATRVRLLDLLEYTITESVAGQQLDVGLSGGMIAPDLRTVLTMSTYKTATYTFELPLRAAAILANASPRLENALSSAGRHLGLAFQLQDDLLSTFGDPIQHGKDPFSDLREGKQTAVIAYARTTNEWPSIEPIFGRATLSAQEGLQLRDLLVACGVEQFVQGLVDEQLRSFYELVSNPTAEIPDRLRRVLVDLGRQLEGRQS